jgi:transcriptional regulator with XRE-family HTH domain
MDGSPDMDWKKLIADLMEKGVKQAEIAERCDVSQGTVSDLHTGRIKRPNFEFGTQLQALHTERMNSDRAQASRRQDETVKRLRAVVGDHPNRESR